MELPQLSKMTFSVSGVKGQGGVAPAIEGLSLFPDIQEEKLSVPS